MYWSPRLSMEVMLELEVGKSGELDAGGGGH